MYLQCPPSRCNFPIAFQSIYRSRPPAPSNAASPSLSKAYVLIDRFSEAVDLTLNIRQLWPEVDLFPAVNPSQADKRRKAADRKLRRTSGVPRMSMGSRSTTAR